MDTTYIEVIILSLGILVNAAIALLAYVKNPKSATNILFTALSFAWIAWTTATFISLHFDIHRLALVRLVMFCVVVMNSIFFVLAQTFPRTRYVLTKRRKILIGFAALVSILTLTPLIFSGIEVASDGSIAPLPGPAVPLFMIHALIYAVGGSIVVWKRTRRSKGTEKAQLRLLLAGTFLFFTLVPLTNFVMPVAFGNSSFVFLSPVFTTIFAVIIAFAIIRRRLFDVRAVIARAIAYVLILITLAGIYGTAIFAVSSLIFGSEQTISTTQNMVYIALAVIVAFTFQPIKRFFDKLTDRIFFQDRYDSQHALNKLSSILAAEINIDKILHESLWLLSHTLRVNFGAVMVVDESKLYKFQKYGRAPEALPTLNEMSRMKINRIAVTDEINDTKRKNEFLQHDIFIATTLYTQNGLVGYLFFGPKQSGSIYSEQDIRLLEIASKELAIAVENARSYEKIQAFNITLQEEVKAATAELRVKNRKLKELDKAKDDFISMASHQLRTPLTTVKGYLSMMLEGDTGKISSQQKKIIDLAYFSSQRMVFLITDLLNVSRVNTGKFVIESTPVNLLDVVKTEVGQLERTAEGHQVKLETNLPKEFPTVQLDDNKTRQVMMNFIDNAIYYTPAGGTVTIELEHHKSDDTIEFRVKDTGIGVPERDKQKLFTKFFRADNAKQQRPDGTGLGLFMAKKVITAQGGSVIFDSRVGKGSTFGFRFSIPVLNENPPK